MAMPSPAAPAQQLRQRRKCPLTDTRLLSNPVWGSSLSDDSRSSVRRRSTCCRSGLFDFRRDAGAKPGHTRRFSVPADTSL
jgi:hypothetical protein